ncbi:hypothetical protein QJQ45_028493, partial [Haematococcus lacustris]
MRLNNVAVTWNLNPHAAGARLRVVMCWVLQRMHPSPVFLRSLFCLIICLVASRVRAWSVDVQHSLDGSSFVHAGVLEGNTKASRACKDRHLTPCAQANLTFTRQPLSSADLAKLQQLAQDDKFYTLRLPGFTSSVRASCFATLPGASQPQVRGPGPGPGPGVLIRVARAWGHRAAGGPGGRPWLRSHNHRRDLTRCWTPCAGMTYHVQGPGCSSPPAPGTQPQALLPTEPLPVQQQSSVMGPSLLVAGAQGYGGQEVVPPGGYSKPGAGGGRLPAGGSPIDRPLGVMPGEHGAMSGSGTEAAKPEKSWLEKNWMFLGDGWSNAGHERGRKRGEAQRRRACGIRGCRGARTAMMGAAAAADCGQNRHKVVRKVMRSSLSFTRTVLCILLCYLLCVEAIAPKPRNRPARRPPPPKRPVPLKGKAALDREYNNRKKACEQLDTIRPCIEQEVDTQNCAMRCISAACYSRHFAEELEEGELANDKAQRFKRLDVGKLVAFCSVGANTFMGAHNGVMGAHNGGKRARKKSMSESIESIDEVDEALFGTEACGVPEDTFEASLL